MATIKYRENASAPWETVKALPSIGQAVEITATELAGKSTADRAAMYAAGTRLLKVINGDTEVLLGLDAGGSTEWLGSNKPVRNLLDNSDFANLVNQRGKSSYVSGTNEYGIDRWFLWSDNGFGTQTINSGSITVSPQTASQIVMSQRFEKGYLNRSIFYTKAIKYTDGTLKLEKAIIKDQQSTNYDAIDVVVESAEKSILWAAVYEGRYTADTLPPYTPKGYAAELAECMRYFRKIKIGSIGKENYIGMTIPLSPQMRIAPTTMLSGGINTSKGATQIAAGALGAHTEYIKMDAIVNISDFTWWIAEYNLSADL